MTAASAWSADHVEREDACVQRKSQLPTGLNWWEVVEAFEELPPPQRRRVIGALLGARLRLPVRGRLAVAVTLAFGAGGGMGYQLAHVMSR